MRDRLHLNHTAKYWHKKYREEKERGDRIEAIADRLADTVVDRENEIAILRRDLTEWLNREDQRCRAARQGADHRIRVEANRAIRAINNILQGGNP